MNIISWNVHCDIDDKKYNHIKTFSCDILILLECRHKSFDAKKNDWEYAIWYNDTLYENQSDYGVAIFSNKYRLDFTDNFNRNLRYVIPLKVSNDKDFLFYLFIVWTKSAPVKYSLNVLKALEFPGYKEYISDKAIFIGDFNTNVTENKHAEYVALIEAGLIDVLPEEKKLPPTYSHSNEVNYFTADYCLVTKKMKESYEISETVETFNDSIPTKNKYKELSDHCPIIVEIKSI